jgi:hypothetical protein
VAPLISEFKSHSHYISSQEDGPNANTTRIDASNPSPS